MSGFQRFENIEACQKTRELMKQIYTLPNDGQFVRDFGLRDQIRRASVSIMSNIVEGFGKGGNKAFAQFLSTAKGSASELQTQLYVAIDTKYITQEQFQRLYDLIQSIENMINGLIRYLSKSSMKGVQYEAR